MSGNLGERLKAMDGQQRRFLLETLAGHLVAAGQSDRLSRLFGDDEWMAARVEGGNGTYNGYLEDLGVAWHETDASFDAEKEIESYLGPRARGGG